MRLPARLAQSAPVRLWRYLANPPGGTYGERYEAMSEEEKAQERWRSLKRNGLFLTFVDTKPRRTKQPSDPRQERD